LLACLSIVIVAGSLWSSFEFCEDDMGNFNLKLLVNGAAAIKYCLVTNAAVNYDGFVDGVGDQLLVDAVATEL
jgi:hypothetical protein